MRLLSGTYMNRYCLTVAFLFTCMLSPSLVAEEVRAIWVTRYDYESGDDVKKIVAQCAALGANRILFQVRGNGSVFYRSAIEPWSERLGGGDPGFDPLATAVSEARERGLAVEAWINVMPLWKGDTLPKDPKHPYLVHPEWVVVGSDGKPQKLNEHYVCGNPARDDFRAHVAAIAGEIASRYEVDAIHLDYIRYVTDLEQELDFSYDDVTLKRFGSDPKEAPDEWRRFKEEQVTRTVATIRESTRNARKSCRLTAAVFAPKKGRVKVFQDVERWVQEGLLDALYPMCYSADMADFAKRLRESLPLGSPGDTGASSGKRPGRRAAGAIPVYPGIGVFKHEDPGLTRQQIETVRGLKTGGFCLFCYSSFFESIDRDGLYEPSAELREQRVLTVRALLKD
ncbi:glycoside hydrolase family 10 protein [Planctomycetota bacterium]